jgi:hypothetical protein
MVFKVDHFIHSILHTCFECLSKSLIASFFKLQPLPNASVCCQKASKTHFHQHCKKLKYIHMLWNYIKYKSDESRSESHEFKWHLKFLAMDMIHMKVWNLNYHHKHSIGCYPSHCCTLFALYLNYFPYLIILYYWFLLNKTNIKGFP